MIHLVLLKIVSAHCFIRQYLFIFVLLKNYLSISLLTVYLFSATELHQLIKLPVLIEHYIEHKEQNNNLSLWFFLYMHYADTSTKDADYDQDMKLPFKSHSECSSLSIAVTVPPQFPDLIKSFFSEKKEFSAYNENVVSSAFLSFVWQPPKTC